MMENQTMLDTKVVQSLKTLQVALDEIGSNNEYYYEALLRVLRGEEAEDEGTRDFNDQAILAGESILESALEQFDDNMTIRQALDSLH